MHGIGGDGALRPGSVRVRRFQRHLGTFKHLFKPLSNLAQAAGGVWLVPWLPVLIAILIAWRTPWALPPRVVAVVILGWPVSWYLGILRGDELENAN